MASPNPDIAQLHGELRAFGARFDAFEARTDQRFASVLELIATKAADTRRHFDVVAGRLVGRIQRVAEGVAFREETRENFERVDRRFLHLEARVSALERR